MKKLIFVSILSLGLLCHSPAVFSDGHRGGHRGESYGHDKEMKGKKLKKRLKKIGVEEVKIEQIQQEVQALKERMAQERKIQMQGIFKKHLSESQFSEWVKMKEKKGKKDGMRKHKKEDGMRKKDAMRKHKKEDRLKDSAPKE